MAAHHTWSYLPSIIIVEILSYLSLADRINASSCCKRWRSCLYHPCMWRSLSFKVENGCRRRAKHLADMCGRFVREAVVEFNCLSAVNVREFMRIIDILTRNVNLEKLALRPSSCQITWPERRHAESVDVLLDSIEKIVCKSRHLRHLSLGCMEDLTDRADMLVTLLSTHQSDSLSTLHLASIKENPDSYGILDISPTQFSAFHNLSVLGLDYDYTTNQLLRSFVKSRHVRLEKLVIHVHGIEIDHDHPTNATWGQLVKLCPKLEVTLNLLHSVDGAACMLDLLRTNMPLVTLRLLFCSQVNVAGIDFVSQHHANTLRSLYIIDGMSEMRPNVYETETDEDPFVMLAWQCHKLHNFTFIGYDICRDDVIAIARLRGNQLRKFDIAQCCVSEVEEGESGVWLSFGSVDEEFSEEISRSLGYPWRPLTSEELHPACQDVHVDADTAYLSSLLDDQAW